FDGASHGAGGGDQGDGGAGGDAAASGDGAAVCTQGETRCVGHAIETCDGAGGYVAADEVVCPFTCQDDASCTRASNIAASDQLACGADAPKLIAHAGAVVAVHGDGGGRITCSDCEGGVTEIQKAGTVEQGATDLTYFCLAQVTIPVGVTLAVDPGLPDSFA